MNFEREIEKLQRDASTLATNIEGMKRQHAGAKVFTAQLLARCKAMGITNVAIARKHKSVPSSVTFPFGPNGSIFAFQPEEARKKNGGWSPIWKVVEEMGISGGCGNHDQHSANVSYLIDGVYVLSHGQWRRVDETEK